MKINRQDSGLLIVKENGGFFILLAFLFMLFTLTLSAQSALPIWVILLFAVISFAVIAFTPFITVTFDKSNERITFCWKRLVGSKTEEYGFKELKEVVFESYYNHFRQSDSRPRRRINHDVVFIFENKKVLLKDKGLREREIAHDIAQFLNVPFSEKRV